MKTITRQLREEIIHLSMAQDRFEKSMKKIIESRDYGETPLSRETRILLICLYDLQDIIRIQSEEFSEYSERTIEAEKGLDEKQAQEEADTIMQEIANRIDQNNGDNRH